MSTIRDRIIVLTDDNWSRGFQLPVLTVVTNSTVEMDNLESIMYRYDAVDGNVHQEMITGNTIEAITNSIVTPINQEQYQGDCSLVGRLSYHISKMNKCSKELIKEEWEVITNGDVPTDMSEDELLVNTFVLQVSFYLAVCGLVHNDTIQLELPVGVLLPHNDFSSQYLTSNSLYYMTALLFANTPNSNKHMTEVTTRIAAFYDLWGHVMVPGELLDTSKIMYSIVRNTNTIITGVSKNMSIHRDGMMYVSKALEVMLASSREHEKKLESLRRENETMCVRLEAIESVLSNVKVLSETFGLK